VIQNTRKIEAPESTDFDDCQAAECTKFLLRSDNINRRPMVWKNNLKLFSVLPEY
jgi:hypothetical protein